MVQCTCKINRWTQQTNCNKVDTYYHCCRSSEFVLKFQHDCMWPSNANKNEKNELVHPFDGQNCIVAILTGSLRCFSFSFFRLHVVGNCFCSTFLQCGFLTNDTPLDYLASLGDSCIVLQATLMAISSDVHQSQVIKLHHFKRSFIYAKLSE